MRLTIDDLTRMAALAGTVIPRADLERLLPSVTALYQDVDRLRELPIAGAEPAFTPAPRPAEGPETGRP